MAFDAGATLNEPDPVEPGKLDILRPGKDLFGREGEIPVLARFGLGDYLGVRAARVEGKGRCRPESPARVVPSL